MNLDKDLVLGITTLNMLIPSELSLAHLVLTYLKDRSTIVITSPCFSCTGLSKVDPFICVGFVELKLNNTAYK